MRMGGQTVTVVTKAEDLNNRDRYNKPAIVTTEVVVKDCHFAPARGLRTWGEDQELGDISTEVFKLTAPPNTALLAAKARDEVKVNGVTYQIRGGVQPFYDMGGALYKITVYCERRVG